MTTSTCTAKERYTQIAVNREHYLRTFRMCAALTVPHLMPPEGWTPGKELRRPAQSDGARGVNSLATKYLLGLLPTNIPNFKLEFPNIIGSLKAAAQGDIAKAKMAKANEQLKANLAKIPREALTYTSTFLHRPKIFESFKHVICGGNNLLWMMMSGDIRSIPLSKYCVLRDELGKPIEIIIEDKISAANLPPKLKGMFLKLSGQPNAEKLLRESSEDKGDSPQEPHTIYTYAKWNHATQRYRMVREYMETEVPDTESIYKEEDFPLVPLAFARSDGQDYGNSLVNDYIGVLMSLEAIAQAEATLAIAMSDFRYAIHPASGMRARDFMNTPIHSAVDVDPNHIKAITADKYGDLNAIANSKASLQREFGSAFLVFTSVARDAERVTAEEIRMMVQMLDEAQGGQYTALSGDFQMPYTRYQLRLVKKFAKVDINKHRSNGIRPKLITGIEALGQNSEASQVITFFQALGGIFGEAEVARRTNVDVVGARLGGNFNLDTDGFFRSQEELDAEAQAQAADEQNRAAVGPIINQAGGLLKQANEA